MKQLHNIIWYERHRPDNLDDLVLLRSHRSAFESFMKSKAIPHLLFHGPPGSGKTTIAMILIEACASARLILNASSSDRGIATIKTTVKNFARSSSRKKSKTNIIFFDEADGITSDAQFALKNTIERYHENCRFVFTANHLELVIPEIQSRCISFKLEQVHLKPLLSHLQTILKAEKIEYDVNDVVALIKHFSYDVRTIINNLQAASISGTFNLKDILSIFSKDKIFRLIKQGKIKKIREITKDYSIFLFMYKALFNEFIQTLDARYRPEVSLAIAEYLWRDRSITDKEINFAACTLEIMDLIDVDPEF